MKSPKDKPESKKPYRPPRLLVYGDLRTLTQMIGSMAQLDGGPMMLMSKS